MQNTNIFLIQNPRFARTEFIYLILFIKLQQMLITIHTAITAALLNIAINGSTTLYSCNSGTSNVRYAKFSFTSY